MRDRISPPPILSFLEAPKTTFPKGSGKVHMWRAREGSRLTMGALLSSPLSSPLHSPALHWAFTELVHANELCSSVTWKPAFMSTEVCQQILHRLLYPLWFRCKQSGRVSLWQKHLWHAAFGWSILVFILDSQGLQSWKSYFSPPLLSKFHVVSLDNCHKPNLPPSWLVIDLMALQCYRGQGFWR